MKIILNRNQGIQAQIAGYFREEILTRALKMGSKLPTVRVLSEELSVSPLTVSRAYKKLEREGLIETVQGSGTYVCLERETDNGDMRNSFGSFDWMLSIEDNLRRTQFISAFSVENLSKGYNMFTSLFRSADYPYEKIKALLESIVANDHELLFKYSPVNGDHLTRKIIASYLNGLGLDEAKSSDIIMTSGSQQALNIIARTFINENDSVLVETPTFPGAIDAFQNQGCVIHSIPLEKDGINIDLLEEMVNKHKPKILYLTPNLNNPTGVITSNIKKQEILEIAKANNMMIIEDDPWCELIPDGHANRLMKSYDEDGHVIFVKGFSKIIGPGFRVGAIYAQGTILNRLTTAKANADLGSPLMNQRLLSEIIASGLLNKSVEALRRVSLERLSIVEKTLAKHAPDYLKWIRPDGGINLWMILPSGFKVDRLLEGYCHPNDLTFLSGRLCYPNEPDYNTFRLSYSALKTADVEPAIKLLCEMVRAYHDDLSS